MKVQNTIEMIKLLPSEKRGGPHVQIVCVLGPILELAVSRQQKSAIQEDGGIGKLFIFALPRNRRYWRLSLIRVRYCYASPGWR